MWELNLAMTVMGVLVAGFLILWLVVATRFYLKFRGTHLIVCPETKRPAAVEVAVGSGAFKAIFKPAEIRLRDCTRWPERRDCGQYCLSQVEAAPEDCLVSSIVRSWYAGKTCVYCHRGFGDLHWHDHRPALLDPAGKTVQWHQVRADELPDVLATHKPVCWNCHVAESFRREHPELIVDRTGLHLN